MFAAVSAAELVEFVDGKAQEAGPEMPVHLSVVAIGADDGPFVFGVL